MKKYIGLLFAMLVMVSCESLEDTYEDFAGNGPVRYLGKCTDLTIQPGWNRLQVRWTNSPDPVIRHIRITWSKDAMVKEELVDRETSEYDITDLEDGSYEVTICAVDKNGNTSLESTDYGRPYTENHEMVQAFTRVISRHFFFQDRLILFFLGWEDNVNEAYLTYTKNDGTTGRLDLTKKIVNSLYYMVPEEIDLSKPVEFYRKGYISGCTDEIVFQPIELEHNKIYNADFRQDMLRQYGYESIPEEWANTVETLELDRSFSNFADLLNFPNLKTLVLGKHRYILEEMVDDIERSQSKVYDVKMSNFVLKTLKELNGLTIERYNQHYKDLMASLITEMGEPELPEYDYLNLSGQKFTSNPADEGGANSHLEYLTDNDPYSCWEPYAMKESTTYDLDLDLGSEKTLRGLKLVQTYFSSLNAEKRAKAPNTVKIYVSTDGNSWQYATWLEELEIGNSTGETNIIPFAGEKQARYVRVRVTTPLYVQAYEVTLAEIGLY